MDDVHFNTSRLQPPRKPETVAPGLESKRNPFDHLAGLVRLVTPALNQSQQRIRIRPKFLQGLAVNAGSHSSCKPARLAHLMMPDPAARPMASPSRATIVSPGGR